MGAAIPLLITRPADEAERLIAAVRVAGGRPFRPIIAPLIETQPIGGVVPTEGWSSIAVSSARALCHARFATDITGRTAFCVGARTAARARDLGFVAVSADGDGEALVQLILSQRPVEPVLYLRGEEVRVDIAQRLAMANVPSLAHVTYRQVPCTLGADALQVVSGDDLVIVPLFSPNAARALRNQGPHGGGIVVLALSQAVADAVEDMPYRSIEICERPDFAAMVELISKRLGGN